MNSQMTVVCLTCQATLTLPFPDGWRDADGHFVAATGSAEEVARFHARMEQIPCQRCGGAMRLDPTRQMPERCEHCAEVLAGAIEARCSFCGNPLHASCILPHEASCGTTHPYMMDFDA